MSDEMDHALDAGLLKTGNAVARLPRPAVPADLAARTIARIVASAPVRKTIWFLSPITNPFARCAAAAAILVALTPLSDLDFAGRIGSRIEDRVVGRQVVDKVETLMDGILPRGAPEGYSQFELDAFNDVQYTNYRAVRRAVRYQIRAQ